MQPSTSKPSKLLLEECFTAADDRFLDEWVQFNSPDILLEFMTKWLTDERPWARQQIVNYLQRDLNFSGHEVFVKRLYRHFESARDHQMLGHFMVAFDRIVRRSRVAHYEWNRQTRESIREEILFAKPNKTVMNQTGRTMEYGTGKWKREVPLPDIINKKQNRLFRQKTRNYLRRRVWRYFRWMSHRDPQTYLQAITESLLLYRDDDFKAGENIIDNWSLMHACYFHSEALCFTAAHTNLVKRQSLSSLVAAPYRAEVWQTPEASPLLFKMLIQADSSLIRIWAMELLQRHHQDAIQQLELATLINLLAHKDTRVQEFALQLFHKHKGLGTFPVSSWLALIEQSDATLLSTICDSMKTHVSLARLDTTQLIQLTCASPGPVAELGFQMLQQRHHERPLSVAELRSLSVAKCDAVAATLTTWTLQQLAAETRYTADVVVEFFDSLSLPMRSAAMDWLEQSDSPGYDDPVLWSKLIETPFDDVRLRLVECLHQRTHLPGTETSSLSHIWCSVLLGVHRGGRTKLKAIQQMQSAILSQPALADTLLPVLAVAVRSLRAPERRGALTALTAMVFQNSGLLPDVQRHLPELQWLTPPVA